MAKKLTNGSVVEFYPSIGFTQCNKMSITFKVDCALQFFIFKTFYSCFFFLFLFFFLSAPLKSAWHLLGGGANVGLLTYRVVGSWLNPADERSDH
jgi:hypothetical protein